MKKMLFIFPIIAAFIFSSTVQAYAPGSNEKDYIQVPYTVFYSNSQNYDNQTFNVFAREIEKMPDHIVALFRQEGIKVYYTDNIPLNKRVATDGSLYLATTVQGWTSYNQMTLKVDFVTKRPHIYIYQDTPPEILIHEYGHALDFIAGYITGTYKGECGISGQDQWTKLYQANKNKLKNIDNHTKANVNKNKSEAFADAFRLYVTKPKTLNNTCPDIYHFIDDLLERYRNYVKPISIDNFDYEAYLNDYPEIASKVKATDKKTLWNYYCQHGKSSGHKAVCTIPKG